MQGNMISGLNLSQEDIVFSHLINYGSIDEKICKNEYGIDYLSSIIRNLRNKKVFIISEITTKHKGNGSRERKVKYFLAPFNEQPEKIRSFIKQYISRHTFKGEKL